jgi:hypothetical protein
LPFVGWPFWFPATGETELSEMSFRKGSVAEAPFDNLKSFAIEQIIIHHSGIGVGKASQLQVMPFLWFGQWPDSEAYGYCAWWHVNFFTNVIKANCTSSIGRVLQKSGIKPHIFCLPHGQIQGWFFADIDVTESDKERLPEVGFPDTEIFWNNPSACVVNHGVATDFYAPRDQACLPISDCTAIGHQVIGKVRQTLSLEGGERSRDKGEYENNKIRPIQGIMLFGCGVVLGIIGLTPVSWRDESLGSGSLA